MSQSEPTSSPQQGRRLFRLQELLLPIGLLVSLLVIVTPLPGSVLDLLLMANIAVSVIILLTTIQVGTPLEFSVFPTVLLASTLGRLVLNIASTRLILTRAAVDGVDAAGGVIRSFGEFVAGDQILVGLVLFAIIAVIQFVVITKGATRISEVSARFALDGMPGRQMAVDADVNAGSIDEAEAKRQREAISQQAGFYGAMDGASKFVRGDAIASVFITVINIVGGLTLGVLQYGMGPVEAASIFTKLTIGDGLVSQLPALLISLAAGLLVTRRAERSNLSVDVVQQLLTRPQVLAVAGVFLVALIFTHLPTIPLLMLGTGCVGGALVIARRAPAPVTSETTAPRTTPTKKPEVVETRIEEYLAVDPVELELGLQFLRFADSKRGGNLLARITQLRQSLAADLGLVLPKVRIRDNLRLAEDQYRIKVQGNPVASAQLPANSYWVRTDPAHVGGPADGTRHPAFRTPLRPVSRTEIAEVQQSGRSVMDNAAIMLFHLRLVVTRHAAELLTRDATKHLIDETRRQSPAVVEELIPHVMKLADVQRILQRLLSEGVSIRRLSTILEALGDEAGQGLGEVLLTERVRLRLARSICTQYRDSRDRLSVVTLDSVLEDRIQAATQMSGREAIVKLPAQEADTIGRAIEAELQKLRRQGRPDVVLVRPEIRAAVKRLTTHACPDAAVLSYSEITEETKIVSLGIVSVDR